jgi:hypothetical protein
MSYASSQDIAWVSSVKTANSRGPTALGTSVRTSSVVPRWSSRLRRANLFSRPCSARDRRELIRHSMSSADNAATDVRESHMTRAPSPDRRSDKASTMNACSIASFEVMPDSMTTRTRPTNRQLIAMRPRYLPSASLHFHRPHNTGVKLRSSEVYRLRQLQLLVRQRPRFSVVKLHGQAHLYCCLRECLDNRVPETRRCFQGRTLVDASGEDPSQLAFRQLPGAGIQLVKLLKQSVCRAKSDIAFAEVRSAEGKWNRRGQPLP